MKKMKITLVYDAIYPYIKGGGEKRFYEIGKRLTKEGHQVHLYGMKFWEGTNVIKQNEMYLHGICKTKKLYTKEGRRSILQAIYFGFHSMKLIKEDFDVIDCCGFPYFSLFSCKLISLIKRKKLFSTWHEVWGKNYWYEYIGWKGYLGYIIEKLAVLMPDKIISVSKHTTHKLKSELNSKKPIYTVPNGIEFDLITKIKPAKEKSDVIFVGRLISSKNIDVLIKSIKLIKKKNPEIKSLIIGDGPEKKKLEALTQKLNLEKNVKFLGILENHDDVYALMKSSKVFVLPSTREGFGIVVIEANACGIPVITVNHKDNAAKDLVKEGKNGFVCQLDEKEIAKNIMKAIKNRNRMKQACTNSAKPYDWDNLMKKLEEVYLI